MQQAGEWKLWVAAADPVMISGSQPWERELGRGRGQITQGLVGRAEMLGLILWVLGSH